MAYTHKPGTGSVFPAGERDKERAGPDIVLSGSMVDHSGGELFVSVYRATRQDGTPVKTNDGRQIYNIVTKAKQPRPQAAPQSEHDAAAFEPDELDNDAPF